MVHIENLREGAPLYEALNSSIRVSILEMLLDQKEMNINDMAKKLGITNGAMTAHIKKLETAGLIRIRSAAGVRGSQKMCAIALQKVIIDIAQPDQNPALYYVTETDIGHYVNYEVAPTCGLVTSERIIGELDDSRYFSFPDRFSANLIWLSRGYLEYRLPNSLKYGDTVKEIQISLEIASEAPGCSEHYPSDIYFSLGGKELGFWTSPGEFNDRTGIFTPSWWFPNLGQYGKLKLLTISKEGTYIDGLKISDVSVADLQIDYTTPLIFRVASPDKAINRGGFSIFGKGFGDYNSGIVLKIFYDHAGEPNIKTDAIRTKL